jgi:AcrR family transcriptional regulator
MVNEIPRRKPGRPKTHSFDVPVREALIRATISQVAQEGPLAVSARQVCLQAGVTFAAVNYNFGSWNGLLAAAGATAYSGYLDEIWDAVLSGPQTPDDRLRSFIMAQARWNQRMPGWGAVLTYPVSALEIATLMRQEYPEIMVGKFQLNLARLAQLTIDVREQSITDFPYTPDDFPKDELLSDVKAVARSTSVGWSVMGMSTWLARGAEGLDQIESVSHLLDSMIDFHVSELIASIKTDTTP